MLPTSHSLSLSGLLCSLTLFDLFSDLPFLAVKWLLLVILLGYVILDFSSRGKSRSLHSTRENCIALILLPGSCATPWTNPHSLEVQDSPGRHCYILVQAWNWEEGLLNGKKLNF